MRIAVLFFVILTLLPSCYTYREALSWEKQDLKIGDRVTITTNSQVYKKARILLFNDSTISLRKKIAQKEYDYLIKKEDIEHLAIGELQKDKTAIVVITVIVGLSVIAALTYSPTLH